MQDSGSGGSGMVLGGSGWFWVVLANLGSPRRLRRVPYDPETVPGAPQLQSGIGNAPFGRLRGAKYQIQVSKKSIRIFQDQKIKIEIFENHEK